MIKYLNGEIEDCAARNRDLYQRLEEITIEKRNIHNAILWADLDREEAALRIEINEGVNQFLRLYYRKCAL